ncbi:MAG: DEAD/DEAH box helicase [Solirubrobacteraceae bacterium]|nr:DEAD/DEAH box helicase [Solirubrobacteraceae bacterium]
MATRDLIERIDPAVPAGDAMADFTAPVRDWFGRAFASPTKVQQAAWPAIASGEHVLISAPTGAGKTLAAFLWALDRLAASPQGDTDRKVRVIYVSPLKALSYDVERNLRAPLAGIQQATGAELEVGLRTGDTSQKERARMLRRAPDILITTPESLYLLLTSRAQELLTHVEAVIVDEIHAVAGTKRGAHMALTMERLVARQGWSGLDPSVAQLPGGAPLPGGVERLKKLVDAGPQRVGLSATQRPLEEIGRFLVGGERACQVIETGERKKLDLQIHVPVESMVEPEQTTDQLDPLAPHPAPGGESTRKSIWPAIYPEILDLVEQHRSTLVFVNNRRLSERVALRINELARDRREALNSGADDGEIVEGAPAGTGSGGNGDGAGKGSPGETVAGAGKGNTPEWKAPTSYGEPGSGPAYMGAALPEIARAHHGSLAREERQVVEELLKSGELPCLVATSSLELGIDMGAVDLVIQIESPKSVSRGLQRIGRAGHTVDQTAKGRIFPKFRADLLECTVVASRMRTGSIETTTIPKNPLDVLAQQIVAIVAAADTSVASRRRKTVSPEEEAEEEASADSVLVDDVEALIRRAYPFRDLPRSSFEAVLDLLDGRYPSAEFSELRPRLVWDRVAGTLRARKGARMLAIVNAGTIPDRGLFMVVLPDGRRVGELDEEMVHEARPGQAFLLGASSWRIEEIQRDRVVVTPAPGVPGAIPFWRGDSVGRPRELGEAIGKFAREAVDSEPAALAGEYDLDERAAQNLVEFLREQRDATTVIPSDRTLVLERFRDEIGDWRLVLLSPLGGRVHAAWALAIGARIREELGLESDVIWSDEGLILHLPDSDDVPTADLILIEPEQLEELVVRELGASALFGSRFRENAARALLLPRAFPGRRTPLWQQRLKAQNLLEVARRHPQFPIVLETYRECLQDVLDVPGLTEILTKLRTRELGLVEVETDRASPMASSLLFDYVATYMYEGDQPNAERRAAALSLDRDLLAELLGQEELRDLLDARAVAQVEDDLQHRTPRARARDADELQEVLRHVGDLSVAEVGERVTALAVESPHAVGPDGEAIDDGELAEEDGGPGPDRVEQPGGIERAQALLDQLAEERRAVEVRIGGQQRWIATDDAGLYRDALGVVPPSYLPQRLLTPVENALEGLIVRYGATHSPFTTAELQQRYLVDPAAVLAGLESRGALVRGELRPGGTGREWCDPEVLRRLRRASLASLRAEIEPSDQRALAAFLPSWHGIDRHAAAGAGPDRLRDVLVPLQGLALPAAAWESSVLPRRIGAYSQSWMDQLMASGELIWVGAGALGRDSGRVALYFREDAPLLGRPVVPGQPRAIDPPEGELHEKIRERLAAGACFFTDLLVAAESAASELHEALWDLVWAGEVTNDAFQPLRVGKKSEAGRVRQAASATAGRRRFSQRRGNAPAQSIGRWSLVAPLLLPEPPRREHDRALAELLLERHGLVTRELVLAEGIPGGFSALYPALTDLETLGVCRRGYFVEGLGGAQFALPGAVDRLRAFEQNTLERRPPVVVGAVDPAQPYGAVLPWPKRGDDGFAHPVGAAVGSDGVPTSGPGSPNFGKEGGQAGPAKPKKPKKPSQAAKDAAMSPAEVRAAVQADRSDDPGRASSGRPRGPQRVAGADVVLIGGEPIVYLERSLKGILVLVDEADERLAPALRALVDHARTHRKRLQLERVDGEPIHTHWLAPMLADAGLEAGPKRFTVGAAAPAAAATTRR